MGCVVCKQTIGGKNREREKTRSITTAITITNDNTFISARKTACAGNPSTISPDQRWSPVPSSFKSSPSLEWPSWLASVAGEALLGLTPRRADSFQKLCKIGQGTYSNVYKVKDLTTGNIVVLKKVRFDKGEPESIKFMAREITLLRRLDHPNVIKLQGLVVSRVSCSMYLIFDYMEHDLAGLAASPDVTLTLPQIKCYMKQLLSGLDYCHTRGVLHRDIKCSNLLIDNQGLLKIADFGLATSYDPGRKRPMTSRVVTLWYRPPELILGATFYGSCVDLWSAGCILAELLAKKPILPGRTEVEQLHKIFRLCGSPTEGYWKKLKSPHAKMFKPDVPYKNSINEAFREFPSSIPLIQTLLSIEPSQRGTAAESLQNQFFTTEPRACDPESLPCYPPSKELDIRQRDEESRRKSTVISKRRYGNDNGNVKKKTNSGVRSSRAVPAPEANAELQVNINKLRLRERANTTSKSEKFPPPHQDGSLGFRSENTMGFNDSMMLSQSFGMRTTTSSTLKPKQMQKPRKTKQRVAPSQQQMVIRTYKPSTVIGNLQNKSTNNLHRREKGKEMEIFGQGMYAKQNKADDYRNLMKHYS